MAVWVRSWPGPVKTVVGLVLVGAIYYVTARFSLGLALVRGQVTPVWPPTGIAVVALLLMGVRVWPAIAVAAFAINLPIGPTPVAAALIAAGNTLAPVVSAVLLKRAAFRLELDRLRDAAAIILLGGLAGMAISATVGTAVLIGSGAVPEDKYLQTWVVWWTGDTMGVVLVAPFLLSFRPRAGEEPFNGRRLAELTALLVVLGVITYFVFQTGYRLEYLVFPLIMAAAIRFRLRGAAPAALIASGLAVWSAVRGTGPFATPDLVQKVIGLQVFNVVVALASFVLASYFDTREREERVSRLYLSAQLANESRSEFMKEAAHELRSPLTVINGYLSLLADGSFGRPPERWRRPLAIVTSKTAELNSIMDDLLDVSRIDGQVEVRRTEIDLRDVVDGAVERATPAADLAGGQISVDREDGPLRVIGDAKQLGRVLDNLIKNGMSYTERRPVLTIRESADPLHAVIRVGDNGLGIDHDLWSKIFEPFYRSDHATVQHVAGTGLGLYISRLLAQSHGGTLAVEKSVSGEGSTFTLSLPLAGKTSDTGSS